MSITKFFVRDATVFHPALVASYGDGTRQDFVTATTETVNGWLYQLTEAELVGANRDGTTATHVFRCPLDSNIIASDRLVIDGIRYDVTGPPARNSYGKNIHLRVPLRTTDG
jgi:SPP1 family predicted phage head-tail adaptor